MIRKSVSQMAMVVSGIGLLAGPVLAQQVSANAAPIDKRATASAQANGVEQAALAADLAAYGRTSRNAHALLLAGQILGGIGAVDQGRSKVSEGVATGGDTAKTGHAEMMPAALFAEARALAGTDQELLARIDRAGNRRASAATRGNTSGPQRHVDSVRAGATDVYTIEFRGNEVARVLAIGDGDTDLDLYIYDENGAEVCSDTDYTDRTICSWTPRWTGYFTVKIKNLSQEVYNRYTLITN